MLDALPDQIAEFEQQIAEIHAQLADPGLYQSQPEHVPALQAELAKVQAALDAAFEQWTELEEKAQ